MHDRTILGLHYWTKCMFEKLGWMTLAHDNNNKEQLTSYLISIKHLLKHIDTKINYIHSIRPLDEVCLTLDTYIHDLEIVKQNLMLLANYTNNLCETCISSKKMKGGYKKMKGGYKKIRGGSKKISEKEESYKLDNLLQ